VAMNKPSLFRAVVYVAQSSGWQSG